MPAGNVALNELCEFEFYSTNLHAAMYMLHSIHNAGTCVYIHIRENFIT
jgi:hypothetical protein